MYPAISGWQSYRATAPQPGPHRLPSSHSWPGERRPYAGWGVTSGLFEEFRQPLRPPSRSPMTPTPRLIITDWSAQTSLLPWSQNVHSWDPNILGAACKEKLHASHIRFPSWSSLPQENSVPLPPVASALRGHGFPATTLSKIPCSRSSSQ